MPENPQLQIQLLESEYFLVFLISYYSKLNISGLDWIGLNKESEYVSLAFEKCETCFSPFPDILSTKLLY